MRQVRALEEPDRTPETEEKGTKGGKGRGEERGVEGDVDAEIGKPRPSRCVAQNLQMFFFLLLVQTLLQFAALD